MGFSGVAITDDLSMDGVLEFMDNDEAAVQAIIAGNDMIIATYYEDQYDAVLYAVKNGTISQERLNEAVTRILRWKQQLGLI
jgi:beta-N-acetylhexosaminidase